MKRKSSVQTVTEITYSRLKSTGQYENERIEMRISVPSGDGTLEARFAKTRVMQMLNIKNENDSWIEERPHGPVCICDECM